MIESMAAKARKKRGSTDKFKFTKARTVFRVMPPSHGMPIWWFTAYIHWTPMKAVSGNETNFPILCNAQHGIGECKICKRQADIMANPNAMDHETKWASQVEAASANYVSVVNLEDIIGPQVAVMCNTVFDRLIEFETEGYDITDPDNGFDIIVNRVMKGEFPNYTAGTVRNPSPIADKDVLKNLADLLTQAPIFTPAQQDAVMRMDGEAIEADDAGRDALRNKLRAGFNAEANGDDTKPAPAAPGAPVVEDATEYWAAVDGQTKSMTVKEIVALGKDVQVMSKDAGAVWASASSLGLLISTPEPAPAAPPEPAPPAAPDAPIAPAEPVVPVEGKVQYWTADAAGTVVLVSAEELNLLPKTAQAMVVGTTDWTTIGELGMGV
jgi:hypothetical protein